jgi:phosphate transport system permease protein
MTQGKTQMSQSAFASLRYRKTRDRIIEFILLLAGLVAVFTTVAIVFILFYESSYFFEHVSVKDFLTDTMWTPLFADAHGLVATHDQAFAVVLHLAQVGIEPLRL